LCLRRAGKPIASAEDFEEDLIVVDLTSYAPLPVFREREGVRVLLNSESGFGSRQNLTLALSRRTGEGKIHDRR